MRKREKCTGEEEGGEGDVVEVKKEAGASASLTEEAHAIWGAPLPGVHNREDDFEQYFMGLRSSQ